MIMTREEEILQKATSYATNDVEYDIDGNEIVEPIRNAFVDGARWADKTLIDKAIKWLEYNFNMPNDFESHFREAMK